jgi:hypothetical protein
MCKKYDGVFSHSRVDDLFPWLALVWATILLCVGLGLGNGRFTRCGPCAYVWCGNVGALRLDAVSRVGNVFRRDWLGRSAIWPSHRSLVCIRMYRSSWHRYRRCPWVWSYLRWAGGSYRLVRRRHRYTRQDRVGQSGRAAKGRVCRRLGALRPAP